VRHPFLIFANQASEAAQIYAIKIVSFLCELIHIIEQDHRFIKKMRKQMKGFKFFHSAYATLDGIEVAHMIRKKQFENTGKTAFHEFYALAD